MSKKKGARSLARSVTPPRVGLEREPADRTAYHRRVMRSPSKYRFVLTSEQKRRMLFWQPRKKK